MTDRTTPEEDARTRRLVLLYGTVVLTTSLAGRTLDPVLPELARDFGTTVEAVALVATAFALPYALVQPILGPVGDGLGKRRIIAVATVVSAILLLACALAPTLGWLVVARAAAGAASGGIYPLLIATFGDAVPLARRGVALSRLLAFSIAGQIAGGVISGWLSDAVGWRAVQAATAATVLAAGLVLLRDLRARPDRPPERVDLPGALRRYRSVARIPTARRLWFAVAMEGVLVFGLFPYVAALIARRGLGGAPEAGIALAAFGLAGIAYAFLSGPLLRRRGTAAVLAAGGVAGLAGMAAVAGALATGPGGMAGGIVGVVAGLFVVGLGYFAVHNAIQTGITDVSPHARGSAVALHSFSFFIGQSLGPLAYAVSLPSLGDVATLLGAGAAILALGLWLSRTVGRPSGSGR